MKIIIIDDEPLIVKGIKNSCPWNKYNSEVVYETSDPEDGLNYILKNKPDIILLDINMEPISGLEILKRARNNNICSEFIIISGYNNFEYAQTAMKYGVYYYILKPINKTELENIISNIIININSTKSKKNSIDFIENLLIENKIKKIQHLFEEFNVELKYKGITAVIIQGDTPNSLIIDISKQSKYIYIYIGDNKICCFINTDEDIFESINIKNHIIGVSRFHSCSINTLQIYYEADIAFYNYFIDKECSKFRYIENKYLLSGIPIELIENFNNTNWIKSFLKNLKNEAKHLNFNIQEIVLIYNYFSIYYEYYNRCKENYSELPKRTYEELTKEFKDLDDLSKYLYIKLKNKIKIENEIIENSKDKNINAILKFIELNYTKNMYLSDIANKFHYNQSYLSNLIKTKLGKTLTEYLIELRISKAIVLLNTTNFTISEIASKIGYNDYCYFTKLFKKQTGLTPSKYRKQNGSIFK